MDVVALNRVIILVRDLDAAMDFFSKKLGIEMVELPGTEVDCSRASMNLDYQIELIAPILSDIEKAPTYIQRWAKYLEEKDNVLLGLSFRLKDAKSAFSEAETAGIHIENVLELPDLLPLPIRDLKELFLAEDDTLGIPMTLVEYR